MSTPLEKLSHQLQRITRLAECLSETAECLRSMVRDINPTIVVLKNQGTPLDESIFNSLSVRSRNILRRADIKFVEEVTYDHLREQRNCGEKAAMEILTAFGRLGH